MEQSILKNAVAGGRPNPLNETEKQWVRDHYKNTPVLQMCKSLNRSPYFIYEFMDNEGLEVFRLRNAPTRAIRTRVKEGFFDDSVKNWPI